MNPLVLAELRLRHAQLSARLERLSAQWRTLPATARAVEMGKQVRSLRDQVDSYAAIIRVAEGMS